MDFLELGEMSGVCEDENCTLTSPPMESCSNQECQWEEQVFGLIELVIVTVIYIPLMLFGLLGNILTILVVWLRPDMRSSTYLYLSSMAVSDLLILLLLPLDLYKLWKPVPWPLGDFACKMTMFIAEFCTFSTILHITFLSLERYLAVCWPITAKTLVTRRRTKAVIGCLWLGAAISAAPVLVMVGVEEVGGDEQGLGEWREGGGWAAWEGEYAGFIIGEREDGHMNLKSVGLEEIHREEEKNESGEIDREIKLTNGENWKQVGAEDGQMDNEGEESKMKEDERGGTREQVDGSQRGETDRRECRCSDYAVSSGLLQAMMILSNLYFLVPLCILGLVYSLIGRALCLRPQCSRRDQSHRNTVKMLGVIVLAFVLCWLPFHVGRTIFSLSLGSVQETHTDPNSHLNTLSNVTQKHTDATSSDEHSLSDISTPNTPDHTPPAANTHAFDAQNTIPFNNTYTHSDTHLYFIYYLSQYFNLVSSVLFYLSAAVNPLLYNLMSTRYRHAVHSLIHSHSHTHSHTHSQTNSHTHSHRLPTLTARDSTTTV